jgi:hypothetical protein
MIYDLTEENFLIFAIKAYNKPNCIMSEFEEDLRRLKYVKRLINKYRAHGNLKERLILNHIIVLSNVFGVEATVKMLFFKLDEKDYTILKTFLLFLNFMPRAVDSINGKSIISADITIDFNIAKKLQEI